MKKRKAWQVVPTTEDTIAAIATPPGAGGIGIVRVSGPTAIAAVRSVFESLRGRDIAHDRGRVFYGIIHDAEGPIDEALVHVMRAPHSYTCEDVVEINCHGGPAPLNAVLAAVLRQGVRLADPGEFTKRAFLNGRIDLVQAEAVLDRIQAHTRAGLRAAASAAGGVLSREIHRIADQLADAKAFIEAVVDFDDQELPELDTEGLRRNIESARGSIDRLLETADAGIMIREGVSIAIAGRPNVGKSSLFNALLRDTRAIVTEYAGTTRDPLREMINIHGISVRLTDTAGLRDTDDTIERLGVDAAHRALRESALVLLVVDGSAPAQPEDFRILDEIRSEEIPAALVWNKHDLGLHDSMRRLDDGQFAFTAEVSALTGAGLIELERALARTLSGNAAIAPDQATVTRVHQKESLMRARGALECLLGKFEASPEFLAMELADAIRALGEITGETTPDEVLERIFKSFCIGK